MSDDLQVYEHAGLDEFHTPMAVQETPTFFGPAESPLFGVVHAPISGRVRGGVLVCGSLGKDHTDTVRGLRVLADRLAQQGILALRFDYLGCGDSAHGQLRDTAVEEWQDSIGHAIAFLEGAGVTDLSAVGLRAGCLILQRTLSSPNSLKRVAYWDPVSTGRRYLREQTAFFKMVAGNDEVPSGVVSTIGARFSAQSASNLSALRLREFPETVDRLLVLRTNGTDPQLSSLAGDGRTEAKFIDGLDSCVQPARLLTKTAWQAIDLIATWLDDQVPIERTPVSPTYSSSTRLAAEDGTPIVETIERIVPHGLFAIRSTPAADGELTVERPTVSFLANGLACHHGPNREWVELSRAVAAAGGVALRWDRRWVGESQPAREGEEVHIYSQEGIDDSLAAARHAGIGASRLQLVGVCSGAYLAALTAMRVGALSVILANQLQWSRRVKKALRAAAKPGDDDAPNWEDTPRARRRRIAQHYLPATAWTALSRTGLVQAPQLTLGPLARRDCSTTVILCPGDLQLFRANKGDATLRRLRRSAFRPELVLASGDHAGFHQGLYPPLRSAVLNFVRS